MSLAVENLAGSNTEAAAVQPTAPSTRGSGVGRFAIAFAATLLVGSGLRAIADAGVSQAIDNYYAKQAAAFSEPVPELVAAINASEVAEEAAATAQ